MRSRGTWFIAATTLTLPSIAQGADKPWTEHPWSDDLESFVGTFMNATRRLDDAMTTCKSWSSTPVHSMNIDLLCVGDGECDLSNFGGPKETNHYDEEDLRSFTLRTCEVRGETMNGEGGTWQVTRLGPFTTQGGMETIHVSGWPLALMANWKVGWQIPEFTFAVREMGDDGQGHGAQLHMPDFHLHHLNQMVNNPSLAEDKQWWAPTTGGDASTGIFGITSDFECDYSETNPRIQCTSDMFYQAMPPGYAWHVMPDDLVNLGLLTLLTQDMRSVGSEPLSWNFEFSVLRVNDDPSSIETTKPRRKTAHKLTFGQDIHKTNSPFNTQLLEEGHAGMNWWESSWPYDGQLLTHRVHTHPYADELWVIAGNLSSCGLDVDRLGLNGGNTGEPTYSPQALSLPATTTGGEVLGTLDEAKAYVLRHLNSATSASGEESAPRIICRHKLTNTSLQGMVMNLKDLHACNSIDWSFKKGEQFTNVAFNYAPPDAFNEHYIWSIFVHYDEYDDYATRKIDEYYATHDKKDDFLETKQGGELEVEGREGGLGPQQDKEEVLCPRSCAESGVGGLGESGGVYGGERSLSTCDEINSRAGRVKGVCDKAGFALHGVHSCVCTGCTCYHENEQASESNTDGGSSSAASSVAETLVKTPSKDNGQPWTPLGAIVDFFLF